MLAGIGTAIAVILAERSVPLMSAVAASGAFLALLAVAIGKYEAAVVLGLVLFGVVVIEPAPTDIVLAVVIIVALATGRFDLYRVPPAVVLAVAAFVALNLVSLVQIVDTGSGMRFVVITGYLVLLALWIASYVRSHASARLVVVGYLVAAVVSAAVGVLALFVAFPGHESLLIHGDRARGFFKDANVFGPFLIPPALLLIDDMMSPRLLPLRQLSKAVLLPMLLFGILGSYSRAAWASFLVGFAVLCLFYVLRPNASKRMALLLIVTFAIGSAAVAGVAATGTERFEGRVGLQWYDVQRFRAQSEGVRLAGEHPLGVGPGQFEIYAPRSAHSTYLRAAAEHGILGLLAIVTLFGATLWFAARTALMRAETYGIGSAALLGSWCGLLLSSAVVDTLHWRHLWLVAGLIWASAAARVIPIHRASTSPGPSATN
ncbi:MAG: O-antigen ligase family protein [Chloroflexota bacterium]|nr:O-antigen ligase family protein [Chloroflexota bacterium]